MKHKNYQRWEENFSFIFSNQILHQMAQKVAYWINCASNFILVKILLKSIQQVLHDAATVHKLTRSFIK